MKALRAVVLLFSLSSYVLGDELLTSVDLAGQTVVLLITINDFGQPTTETLETLGRRQGPETTSVATSTFPTTTPTPTPTTAYHTTYSTTTPADTTTPEVVGQPGPTPVAPGAPTPFVYTTTDADGNYVTVTATFTPTFPPTIPFTPTASGTILQYSDWLGKIGTNTGALNQPGASQAANPASRASANISLLSGALLAIVLAGVLT
jgi:hypothetical protein